MSIDKQKKQPTMEEFLKSLDDESLRRSHNSVNISFTQMLAYIDKIIKPIPPGDINFLLTTYRRMAKMFYTQYELSLLMEITKQRDVQKQAGDAIKYIEGLQHNDSAKRILKKANPLLVEDRDVATIEYQKLIENFPTLLQNALDKLRDEWQRLNTIAVASQTLTKDEKLNRSLKAVVEVAAHSVGVEAERIVIVPGNAFALYFFTYLDNFAVLTVPIYSVQNPWEWSIFWHELAGYKVRRLEKNTTIDTVREKLVAFHNLYKTANKEKAKDLLNSITWDYQFSRTYLSELFSRERLVLNDLGDFEHQFEQMLINLNLSKTEKFQIYDQIKAQGWCVDWFKELFEDAWSVLAIGEPFLEFFKDILGRNVAKDDRHPPLEVRLSVAKKILKLVNLQGGVVDQPNQLEEIVEEIAAQQILKFISLLISAARKFESLGDAELKKSQVLRQQNTRDKLFGKVRDGIQTSISNWSEKFLDADNPLRKFRNNAENFLDIFSDPVFKKMLSELDQYETNQIKPNYKNLLKNRDYKKLLKLSFSEVDYHTPGDIQLLENGRTYWVKPADWNSAIWLTQRHPVGNGTMPTEIVIRDVNGQIDWKVKMADWNDWFKMTQ